MMSDMSILPYSLCGYIFLYCCILPSILSESPPHATLKLDNQLECTTMEEINANPHHCAHVRLKKLGWEKESVSESEGVSSIVEMNSAIMDFQRFFKQDLQVTGILDDATKELLVKPRMCSVKDNVGQSSANKKRRRKKRWAHNGSKWASGKLTWCMDSTDESGDMSSQGQRDAIRKALQMWSDNSKLSFSEVTNCRRAVIQIKFASGYHGDNDPFDGAQGTLAHAYFPRYGGDAHFDEDENWSITATSGSYSVKLFIPIATHEFGHSLGLGHSGDKSAIMYAYYFGRNPITKLAKDDIEGIQALYGKQEEDSEPTVRPPTPQPPVTSKPPTEEPPVRAVCNVNFQRPDALVMLGDGYTYGFAGPYYWRMDSSKAIDEVPKKIEETWFYFEPTENRWKGFQGYIDSALFWPDDPSQCKPTCSGRTFLFKGDQVYILDNSQGTQGYLTTKYIEEVFPGLGYPVDASCLWTYNQKAYFFSGEQYYRTSRTSEPYTIDESSSPYPRNTEVWWKFQDIQWKNVDACVFYWHRSRPDIRRTYFFNKDEYIRYDDTNNRVAPNYPRSTSKYWYGCDDSSSNIREAHGEMEELDEMPQENAMELDIEIIDNRLGMPDGFMNEDNSSSADTQSIIFSLIFSSTFIVFKLCSHLL